MKTSIKYLFLLLFIVTIFIGCSKDDETAPPDGMVDPEPMPVANPIPNKTTFFSNDVQPTINSNCKGCHSDPPTQGAPMALETFQQVVNAVNNRDLFARVSSTGTNVMPTSGRLPDATILLIEDWIADGLME